MVGSRKVDHEITTFVEHSSQVASSAGYSIVSGGAKGVDQTAMRAASEVEGTVVGVLAEKLSSAVVVSSHREAIRSGNMVLVSAVDPSQGFNVGNAMARNKFIYALSDAVLVANADLEKGGTWSGASEQIKRFKCCPVFVRTTEQTPEGNRGLIEMGARPWPAPDTPKDFEKVLRDAEEAISCSLDENGDPKAHEVNLDPKQMDVGLNTDPEQLDLFGNAKSG